MYGLRPVVLLLATGVACSGVRTPLLTGERLTLSAVSDSVPSGWQTDGRAISMRFDSTAGARRGGRPTLRVAYDSSAPYAGIVQRVTAAPLAGRSVELRAHLMRDSSRAKVGIWMMAVSDSQERLAYLNSYDSVSSGPYRWATHRLRLTVPTGTARLLVGAAIHTEHGLMWVSDLSLQRWGR